MKNSFYIAIILILFSFVTDISIPTPILIPFEVNDGESKYITTLVPVIWIYTKINKNSQIIMEITNHNENRVINKEDIKYGKYFKELNKTELVPISLYIKSGNTYKLTYDVSKEQNDYGMVEISNLAIGQTLTINVTIYSQTNVWLIIIACIALGIVLIIVIFLLCRTFLRCCHKRHIR